MNWCVYTYADIGAAGACITVGAAVAVADTTAASASGWLLVDGLALHLITWDNLVARLNSSKE